MNLPYKQTRRGCKAPHHTLLNILIFLVVLNIPLGGLYAAENPYIGTSKYCSQKADYGKEVMEYRGSTDDPKKELKELMAGLDKEWEDPKSILPRYAIVDWYRMVNDAYRKIGDGFRRNDSERFAQQNYIECRHQGF